MSNTNIGADTSSAPTIYFPITFSAATTYHLILQISGSAADNPTPIASARIAANSFRVSQKVKTLYGPHLIAVGY